MNKEELLKKFKEFLGTKEGRKAVDEYASTEAKNTGNLKEMEEFRKNISTENGYVSELDKELKRGEEAFEIFKQRFNLDEIRQIMEYDYRKIHLNENQRYLDFTKTMNSYRDE